MNNLLMQIWSDMEFLKWFGIKRKYRETLKAFLLLNSLFMDKLCLKKIDTIFICKLDIQD